MLTVYPESSLYQEIKAGNWQEESEVEKYRELRVLAESLKIPVCFAALGASNAIPIQGHLPEEKETVLSADSQHACADDFGVELVAERGSCFRAAFPVPCSGNPLRHL